MITKIFRKTLCLVLTVCVLLPCMFTAVNAEDTKPADAAALTAVAASQLNYYENTDGTTKYGKAFGDASMPWGCAFVAWCAEEAAVPTSIIPAYVSCAAMRSFFEGKGQYSTSKAHGSNYVPKPGDIAFFSLNETTSSVTQVGIVEKYDNGTLTTIEGCVPNRVRRLTYTSTNKYVIGFASPAYGTEAKPGDNEYKPGTYITYDYMNFRELPNGNIIEVIPSLTTLYVSAISGVWGQTYYNGRVGWLSLEYSTYVPTQTQMRYRPGIYRTNDYMKFRSTPGGTETGIIINPGTVVTVTAVQEEWGKLTYNGVTGWMSLEYSTYFDNSGEEPIHVIIPGHQEEVIVDDPSANIPVNWLVADISQWNGTWETNWAKMKAAGLEGVIIRIGGRYVGGSRMIYDDSSFYQHYAAVKAAGLHVGVYFFSYGLTAEEGIAEGQYTVNMLKANNCQLDMPVFIDIEDYQSDRSHTRAGRSVNSAVVDGFCTAVENGGYYAGIYCSKAFAEDLLLPYVFENRGVWIAQYGSSSCTYKSRYDMWQYTRTGSLYGYTGKYIDLNQCYVNYPAIINRQGIPTIIDIPPQEIIIDPHHETPNETPAWGIDPGTGELYPIVDPEPTAVREWVTVTPPTCTTDGLKCLYQNGLPMLSEAVSSEHTAPVNCVLRNTSIVLHAGQIIDPDEFASNFYSESSPYYKSLLNTTEKEGGCKFSYCAECGEIISVENIYYTTNCTHRFEKQTVSAATCTAEGITVTVCAKCGRTGSEYVIGRKTHTVGASKVRTDSNGNSFEAVECRICGTVITASYNIVKGDIDGDGKITSSDARLTLRYSVGFTDADAMYILNADIDGNGTIDSADARSVLRLSLKLD